jgi:hypothetical protein
MCDLDAFYTSSPAVIPGLIETTTDIRTWVSDCICSVCSERRDANAGTKSHIFEDFQMIFVDGRELQDHQYMLMPSSIHAYVFRTRTWGK